MPSAIGGCIAFIIHLKTNSYSRSQNSEFRSHWALGRQCVGEPAPWAVRQRCRRVSRPRQDCVSVAVARLRASPKGLCRLEAPGVRVPRLEAPAVIGHEFSYLCVIPHPLCPLVPPAPLHPCSPCPNLYGDCDKS